MKGGKASEERPAGVTGMPWLPGWSPEARISPRFYGMIRSWMVETDPDAREIIEWSEAIWPPPSAEDLAREIAYIILCAGRSAQAARTIHRRVMAAVESGRPAVEGFGYKAKAAAIDDAWRRREALYGEMNELLRAEDEAAFVAWCQGIPFIGDDTKWQLAKNIGMDVCKPDIWLCRLAGYPDKPRRPVRERFAACMALCRQLSRASGDRIATVDSVLWLACNKRLLDANVHGVTFFKARPKGRSIYE
jgi:hypothetical protein